MLYFCKQNQGSLLKLEHHDVSPILRLPQNFSTAACETASQVMATALRPVLRILLRLQALHHLHHLHQQQENLQLKSLRKSVIL